MVTLVKIDLPGLLREPLPSGSHRYRVRVEGNSNRRVVLSVTPDHADFMEHYRAARAGIKLQAETAPMDRVTPRSLAWLTYKFESDMKAKEKAGLMHPSTLQQRGAFYARLRSEYGQKAMEIPSAQIIRIRDKMETTPGAADNMVKAIRAMFAWAIKQGLMTSNPAMGIDKINAGKGATPWTPADLRQFRDHHPPGTMAHLALSLFMFTACRVSDVVTLGPRNEIRRGGTAMISWQPAKKGSTTVTVPIMPPLAKAIAAQAIANPAAYLLTTHGKPFASAAAFGNKFRDWTTAAKLTDRSPHGIRKAAGNLLAEFGATEYQIMAIHGHSSPEASKVYTEGANRTKLAESAMQLLAGMEW